MRSASSLRYFNLGELLKFRVESPISMEMLSWSFVVDSGEITMPSLLCPRHSYDVLNQWGKSGSGICWRSSHSHIWPEERPAEDGGRKVNAKGGSKEGDCDRDLLRCHVESDSSEESKESSSSNDSSGEECVIIDSIDIPVAQTEAQPEDTEETPTDSPDDAVDMNEGGEILDDTFGTEPTLPTEEATVTPSEPSPPTEEMTEAVTEPPDTTVDPINVDDGGAPTEAPTEVPTEPSPPTEEMTEAPTEAPTEPTLPTEAPTEAPTEPSPSTEEITEAVTEPPDTTVDPINVDDGGEAPTEASTEPSPPTEEVTEAATEPSTEQPTTMVTEASTQTSLVTTVTPPTTTVGTMNMDDGGGSLIGSLDHLWVFSEWERQGTPGVSERDAGGAPGQGVRARERVSGSPGSHGRPFAHSRADAQRDAKSAECRWNSVKSRPPPRQCLGPESLGRDPRSHARPLDPRTLSITLCYAHQHNFGIVSKNSARNSSSVMSA
ncbi:nascent polypeptide-associated complex subunit alpha, muscle-specific form-like [Phlebotomus argentipes]|uniref:nascent polypeptide-associated complex subunit alpha, muscle-specific form-like n=1 Tax=Phlebotomus argentipes TaxID=94469 RepID=UPI002893533C|nr:nascent polypeptide-associated complex subunit alpha, muscle-specific form-like [Phlebotomus argentipes]